MTFTLLQRIHGARKIARRFIRRRPWLAHETEDILQDAALLVLEGRDRGYMTVMGLLSDKYVKQPRTRRRLLQEYAAGAPSVAQRTCAKARSSSPRGRFDPLNKRSM